MTVSRRDFLKSAGVTSLATAVTSAGVADVEAQTGPRVVGPGDVPVTLMVNGKRVELKIEPRVTLLDAIRNRADLTGNKRVCDRGTCGACTMIVDGRTVYSCSTLAIEVQGKQIRTVDGLVDRQHAAPGAAGLLRHRRADVRLLHAGLRRRDGRAAREDSAPDAGAGAARARRQHLPLRHVRPHHGSVHVGSRKGGASWLSIHGPRSRRSSARRSSGSTVRTKSPAARATATTSTGPGMLYGKIVRSPHPHARIVSIDLSEAEKAPGVKAVLDLQGAGRAGDVSRAIRSPRSPPTRKSARSTRRGSSACATRRCRTLRPSSRRWPPTRRPCSRAATRGRARREETGDLEAGFAKAAHIVEATYATHVITHVCLETHGCVCEWEGDKLTAWVSTQGVHQAQDRLRGRPQDSAGERPRHHAVHGRRLRQQVRAGLAGHHLREAGAAGQGAGEADARSQGRASRHRQPSVGHRAHPRRRDEPTAC